MGGERERGEEEGEITIYYKRSEIEYASYILVYIQSNNMNYSKLLKLGNI